MPGAPGGGIAAAAAGGAASVAAANAPAKSESIERAGTPPPGCDATTLPGPLQRHVLDDRAGLRHTLAALDERDRVGIRRLDDEMRLLGAQRHERVAAGARHEPAADRVVAS